MERDVSFDNHFADVDFDAEFDRAQREAWEQVRDLAAEWNRQIDEQTARIGIGPMNHDHARLAGLARRMLAST